jgi:signal transduction histidine kinase
VNQPVVLTREQSEQVLRVAREALLNALNHSHANTITLGFQKISQELVLSVSDDGVGFVTDPCPTDELTPGSRLHFGLKIMQARAARLGGQLAIESSPGRGARITLRWLDGMPATRKDGNGL